MDVRAYQYAVSAAQGVMSVLRPELKVDGKWGDYTQSVYDSLDAAAARSVAAVIRSVLPGASPISLYAFRAAQKKTGGSVNSQPSTMAQVAGLIRTEAKRRGYANPEFVVAQAVHESGNGKSVLAAKYNNFGGLKTGIRPNRANGSVVKPTREGSGATSEMVQGAFLTFAEPADWVVTQLDYLERKTQGKVKSVASIGDYNRMMKSFGYYTDDEGTYLAGMKRALTLYA